MGAFGSVGWDSWTGVPTSRAEVTDVEGWDSSEFLFVSQFSFSGFEWESESAADSRAFSGEEDGATADFEDGLDRILDASAFLPGGSALGADSH